MVALNETKSHSARMLKMLEDELMTGDPDLSRRSPNDFAPRMIKPEWESEPTPEPLIDPDKSYLRQNFNGKTLYVSSVMTTPDEVESLIKVLTAFKSLIPVSV